ncbi:MAG: phenylalanine--tRNA ligase subunit alpha [Flavobacteriales bacterium]|nr:phenylalanine--tRNA ligase subunit alpha [Flavobacteriales bacterium]MAO71570.1 phenylalanine--tRNA ligase subunit alpha [Flavobacteriales bacterium]|tara:strand:- start:193 stop:1206 length:1014 start_codon:yes stop_codon:yes gene_type:complete
MLEKVRKLAEKVNKYTPKSEEDLNRFRVEYLGRRGVLNGLFSSFKRVPNEQKKELGSSINNLKNLVQKKIESYKDFFEEEEIGGDVDLSKPVSLNNLGSRHPISLVRSEILDIFNRIGFTISEGPEIEDDWHNFSALNLPEEHPARDMQDTFFIQTNPDILLRTHTSSVQVRHMENTSPPIRTLSPGRVYRNEAVSARAHCIFHQVEGLYIDEKVSFADLKQALLYFAKEMFGEKTKIRLRPSYFPFTEPSAEVDIYLGTNSDSDYRITKGTGWLEILGCGMVDPNVLENCGIDPKKYSGYAFGMGIERIAMLKYGVKDLRLFFENDIRFLKQFSSL